MSELSRLRGSEGYEVCDGATALRIGTVLPETAYSASQRPVRGLSPGEVTNTAQNTKTRLTIADSRTDTPIAESVRLVCVFYN